MLKRILIQSKIQWNFSDRIRKDTKINLNKRKINLEVFLEKEDIKVFNE